MEKEIFYELINEYKRDIFYLAKEMLKGNNVDKQKGVLLLEISAIFNDIFSQNEIGKMLIYGNIVLKNEKLGIYWLEKASDLGNDFSSDNLGKYYQINNDFENAIKWYEESSRAGNSYALNNLGKIYATNEDYYDFHKAVFYLTRAALKQNSYSQNHLGNLYKNCDNKNYEKALFWYKEAAKNNNAYAYNNIGIMYLNGEGVDKNYEIAKDYFLKSIELDGNYASPRYELGYLYYYGNGVEKDINIAYEYFADAYILGYNCDFILNRINLEKNKDKDDVYCLKYFNQKDDNSIYNKVMEYFSDSNACLNNKTKKFIETGIKVYGLLMKDKLDLDYSSVIIPLVKALENEIKIYFVDKYIDFLEMNVKPSNLENHFFITTKGGYAEYDKSIINNFTLGDFSKIIGRKEYQKINIKESKAYIDRLEKYNYDKVETIDRQLLEYTIELFDCDRCFSKQRNNEIINYMISLSQEIRDITQLYRNPSAHEKVMNHSDAEYVIDYLFFKKRLFPNFINLIKR